MATSVSPAEFEAAVLAQLDAAHNLARWLVHNEQDANDVVQESCLKALRASDTFKGGDFRAWLLSIVRNTSFSLLKNRRRAAGTRGMESAAAEDVAADRSTSDPHAIAERVADARQVREAIERLPDGLREVVILRELEGCSYREIAGTAGIPIGTVMSRLARARARLQGLLTQQVHEVRHDV